jgi:hypothetical protein
MMHKVRWSLIGGLVLAMAGILAGCSSRLFVEREPWRHDAEVACLSTGAIQEGAGKVRIQPINGPGMCGADFPFKVSGLGHGGAFGFAEEQRAPAGFGAHASPAQFGFGTRHQGVAAVGPTTVSPAATLACPVISTLEQWIDDSIQPAALRWLGQPVVEIKQISAYSCRGMNGDPNARISEHAFGNALDIAGFVLADGRKISVKDHWNGAPEERAFLRDVQAGACERFTTVLAPGSNAYHYDHIHVDLMRRSNGYRACNPRAVSGAEVAARAGLRFTAVRRDNDAVVTGSVTPSRRPPVVVPPAVAAPTAAAPPVAVKRDAPAPSSRQSSLSSSAYPDGMPTRKLPAAVPGADGEY